MEWTREMTWSVGVGAVIAWGWWLLLGLVKARWLNPRKIRRRLAEQGVSGPTPSSLLHGNVAEMRAIEKQYKSKPTTTAASASATTPTSISHDWAHSIFPYLHHWSLSYGPIFIYSTGRRQNLHMNRLDLMRFLNIHKPLELEKPSFLAKTMGAMFGNGILNARGQNWTSQRRLLAPQFYVDKVKGMKDLMENSTMEFIRKWENRVSESENGVADMYIDEDLANLSADIISRACFGTSYSQGEQIFAKLRAIKFALSRPDQLFGFGSHRLLPTKANRGIWRLTREVDSLILKVVQTRQEQNRRYEHGRPEKDLLQLIVECANGDGSLRGKEQERFIIDTCKNIYFAGHETTATAISWTLMLLAVYPEWQERARAEIMNFCGDQIHPGSLDFDALRKLKVLTMVIQESLRLYGPAIILVKEARTDMIVGDMEVPRGVILWTSIPMMHRDPENWGPDANEFKPERFRGGMTKACKYPHAYVPFGYGSRLCLGQTFAMLELKIVLTLLLARFLFALSPKYQHSPVYKMVLTPEHGIRLVVTKV